MLSPQVSSPEVNSALLAGSLAAVLLVGLLWYAIRSRHRRRDGEVFQSSPQLDQVGNALTRCGCIGLAVGLGILAVAYFFAHGYVSGF